MDEVRTGWVIVCVVEELAIVLTVTKEVETTVAGAVVR
jgi:hypothetical protein